MTNSKLNISYMFGAGAEISFNLFNGKYFAFALFCFLIKNNNDNNERIGVSKALTHPKGYIDLSDLNIITIKFTDVFWTKIVNLKLFERFQFFKKLLKYKVANKIN